MTINHLFVYVQPQRMASMRSFYRAILQPLGYTELLYANGGKILGFGSDYPYIFLQQVPENHQPYPAHIAVDAPSKTLYKILSNGGKDNGKPGIRHEMSRQPYYAGFIIDPEGNNLEAVCVDKKGVRN
ncbi:hypothetical protein N0V90_002698 [Kalmusia sp. IMI 367209]|nr:hypothetical protein N0V90_002698 [Kalmusia sp. IMI 367209]